MLFPMELAVYIDKVKGDEAVLSQAYSWGTPIHRDYSSLPKVTHRKSVAELGNEMSGPGTGKYTSIGQYLQWNISTISTSVQISGSFQACSETAGMASFVHQLHDTVSKIHLCKNYCVLSERTRLKFECWVPYTIP